VEGFWSITMYFVDGGWQFSPNELNKLTVSMLCFTISESLTWGAGTHPSLTRRQPVPRMVAWRWLRMRRVTVLLSLIAALTGTPLRQAEAASDFSRILASLLQPAQLESPDGGVGDDSGVTLHSGSQASLSVDLTPSADPLLLPPPLIAFALSPEEAVGLRQRVWWPPAPPNIRHAWLQLFLF
jgi:hypothetical protein